LISRGLIPKSLRQAVDASSASLPHHPDGGSTCAAVPPAAMSDAVTHHRASTRVRITGTADTGLFRASSRAKIGTGTSPPTTTAPGRSWHRRHTIRRTSPCPGPRESSPPTGCNDCVAEQAGHVGVGLVQCCVVVANALTGRLVCEGPLRSLGQASMRLYRALRCLKRRLSDAAYRCLLADLAARSPGGHVGASLQSSAADLIPMASTSEQSLPGLNHDATPIAAVVS
jgi:hypothetical protein